MIIGISCTYSNGQNIPNFQEGHDGLLALGQFLVESDEESRKAVTSSLRPEKEDYESVFRGKFARRVRRYHNKYWRRHDPVMRPARKSQTEPHCWSTTPDSLAMYKGNARHFPGGYREIADKFQPGLRLYRLKLVKPGMRLGTSFDVFVYLEGRWKIFPKPWFVHEGLLRE